MKKKKSNAGRPTIFTKDVLDKLDQAYAMDCTDAEAALYADISLAALLQHGVRHPEFVKRKHALKQRPFLIARNTIINGIKSDADLALKYMERKKKDEFSVRNELDVKASGGTWEDMFGVTSDIRKSKG